MEYQEFEGQLLVTFDNERIARFQLIEDRETGLRYLNPNGKYMDNGNECILTVSFDAYKKLAEDAESFLFIRTNK